MVDLFNLPLAQSDSRVHSEDMSNAANTSSFSGLSLSKAAETVRQHVRSGETPHRACNWVLGALSCVPDFIASDDAFAELAKAAGFSVLRGPEARAASGYGITCVGTVEDIED